jgi:DNA-binding transcriptional ArsR family regulator
VLSFRYDVLCEGGGGVTESGTILQLAYEIARSRFGRRRLAESTGRTEMSVRLDLERLRDEGLIELRRIGTKLTAAGRRRFAALLRDVLDVRPLALTTLAVDDGCVGGWVRSVDLASAWVARDVAVRGGATGLVLLRFESDGWAFAHDGEVVQERNPADAEALGASFPSPEPGDLLLLAFGPDHASAGRGLWALLAEAVHR